jgi:WD40 repeat protein
MIQTNTLVKAQKITSFKRSLAVVIGINEYQNKIPKLQTARRDAEVLAQILAEEHQYDEVILITDETECKPTLKNLLTLLEERLPKEIQPTKDDRLLFYFAGHGIARDSDKGPAGYLVPQDADLEKNENLLPMQKLHECLNALSCRHLLVILDCCFAGTLRWSTARLATVIPTVIRKEHYDRFIKSPAWQAITSAAHNQEALDTIRLRDNRGGVNHSPFALALFKALRGEGDVIPAAKNGKSAGDGVITATELYLYLRDNVETASNESQTPGIWTLSRHDRGEYIFLVPGADPKLKPAPKLTEKNNPYRGLQSFEEEHSQLFFGRKELVEELYKKVSHTSSSLTVVLGVSGSGKSSLVKAGLIPYLRQHNFREWYILKPMRPSESPFTALARTLLLITNNNEIVVSKQLDNLHFINEIIQQEITDLNQKIDDGDINSESDEISHLEQKVKKYERIADICQRGTKQAKQLLIVDNFDELNNLCRVPNEQRLLKEAVLDCLNPLSQRLQNPNEFIKIVKTWSKQKPGISLLLVIDQFEELITLSSQDKEEKQNKQPNLTESQQFLKLLEAILAANMPQLSIVVTLRSDFEPRFLNSEALKSHWTHARFPVRAMRSDELRQAIERPAAEMALYFEQLPEQRNPVDKLVEEVGQMPGALPLLSFTLSELYIKLAKKWETGESSDRALTLDAEFDFEGGVAGSLTQRANKEYDSLPDDAHRDTMQRVMLRMVTIEGGESARRRVPLSELVYAHKHDPSKRDDEENQRIELVLKRLIKARLVVSGQETGEPYVEPAHDFLVRSWDKLQKWQQQEQQDLALQRRLTPNALEWKNKEQSASVFGKAEPVLSWFDKKIDSAEDWFSKIRKDAQERQREKKRQFLWNGNPYLEVLKKKLKSADYWFNQVESEFVQQSVWQRRRYTNLRRAATGLAFLVLMGILSATYIQKELADLRAKAATAKNILPEPFLNVNGLLLAIESTGRSQSPILKRFLGSDFSSVQSSLRAATEEVQDRNILYGKSPVAISPDGQYIVTTGSDEITLRDRKGNEIVNFPVKDAQKITFSPDDQKILTITSAGQMHLWTLQGDPIHGFPISVGDVNSVVFSSNGEMIATGSGSDGSPGRVQLWNLQGNPIYSFSVPGGKVNSVAISPNGQTIVTGSGSDGSLGRVQLWNLRGNPGYGFPVSDGGISSVAISPDGRMIVAGSAGKLGKVWLWDLQSNRYRPFPIPKVKDEASLDSVAFTSDSQKIISISNGEGGGVTGGPLILRLWNLTGKLIKQSVYNAPDIATNDDGRYAVTGSNGGSASPPVKLWDLQSNPINVFSGHKGEVNSVAISPDGQTIVSGGKDQTVRLWNLQGQSRILNHGGIVNSVAISPDGQTIVSGSDDKTVRLWDIQGKPISQPLAHEAEVKEVAISPDGQKIISVSEEVSSDSTVHVWDIQGNPIRKPFKLEGSVSSIAFYDNQTLVIGNKGDAGEIQLLDLLGNTIGKPFQERGNTRIGYVGSIAVSPDGKTIIAGTDNYEVQLWNQQGKLIGQPFANSAAPFSVAFSSDGQYIVTGHGDNTVRLWDNQGNQMGEPLQIHEDNGAVESVAISRDGQYIVSGSDDGTVQLWRAGNWQTWLQIACNRLQYHRFLNESEYLDGNGNEVRRGARATCQKYWKNAPSPAPSSNNGQNSYRQAPRDRNQASY